MHHNEEDPYDAVAAQRRQHSLEVRPGDVGLQLERSGREVADVIRTECCKKSRLI